MRDFSPLGRRSRRAENDEDTHTRSDQIRNAATMIAFSRVNRVACWLLAPYLGWVCLAASLNHTLWRLNP